MFVDQIGYLAHLNARDRSFVLVLHAPIATIEVFRRRRGGEYQDGEMFGLSVFLRDGDAIATPAQSRLS